MNAVSLNGERFCDALERLRTLQYSGELQNVAAKREKQGEDVVVVLM